MSEDPLANKSLPPSAVPETEYDIIYATVSETAQGRRFLQEYARRCRPSDTEATLATIERMQAAIHHGGTSERLEILLEIADMAQAIVRLRAEILAMKPPGGGQLEATEELDSIVQTTESATSRILAAAEQVQEIAWTMRESGSIEALCDELDTQATEIYTACSFQDLTGQRTRKVIQVLRYLEERINAMVTAREKEAAEEAAAGEPSSLMQADVDAVMRPGASVKEERQDATLEDISRLMLAIEPMIGLQEKAAEAHQPAEDVRPELSVAEAVMAEADSAHALADWEVHSAPAPARPPSEDAAPLADWVVEDPSAPQPDAEPAWMILRRMEAELDEQREAATTRPVAAIAASSRVKAEPALFAAEPMSQLAQRLQPETLLPPAELFRSNPKSVDPLAELGTAMAAAEMKLLQPGEDADRPVAAQQSILNPSAVSALPPDAPASNLVQRAAATVIEPRAPAATPAEETLPPEGDADDFLFAPEKTQQEPATRKAAAEEPVPPVVGEWEGGTFPDPALVTPKTQPPPQAEAEELTTESRAAYDPLAPLRAMSDAEKIALFS